MQDSSSKRPTHRAYAVTKHGEKSFWREIGAVWQHEDGKGFSLKLDLLPLGNGADIVIREPKAEPKTAAVAGEPERNSSCGLPIGRASARRAVGPTEVLLAQAPSGFSPRK